MRMTLAPMRNEQCVRFIGVTFGGGAFEHVTLPQQGFWCFKAHLGGGSVCFCSDLRVGRGAV